MSTFFENTSFKAKWWLPNENDKGPNELYGELTYDKYEGLKLEIKGSFYKTTKVLDTKEVNVPIIHGRRDDGTFITLINIVGREFGQNNWIYTEAKVEYALINEEGYVGLNGMKINQINFHLNCFHEFFDCFKRIIRSKLGESKLEFVYDEIPPLDIVKNDKIHAYLYFSHSFSGLNKVEFVFREKKFLNVKFTTPLTFEDAVEKIKYYRDFFAFFSHQVVSYESVNVFLTDGTGDQQAFSLLFNQNIKEIHKEIQPYEILIEYGEMSHNIGVLFQNWIEQEERNKGILALYMQVAYLRFPSDISAFLNMVFAIETLHNVFFDDDIFDKAQLLRFKTERKSAFQNCFSAEFHPKLSECLSHFSKPSFAQRLKDLISRNNEFISSYIKDTNEFVKVITKQRNFLAHDHSEQSKSVITARDYQYHTTMLKLIFEISFLGQAGLEVSQISTMINRNLTYNFYKRRNFQQ